MSYRNSHNIHEDLNVVQYDLGIELKSNFNISILNDLNIMLRGSIDDSKLIPISVLDFELIGIIDE